MNAAGDGEMDERVAQLEDRLKAVEQRRIKSARGLVGRVIPAEVRRHFMAGQREQLLAMRALVDYWIEQLDARGAAASPRADREDIPID